MDVKRTYVVNTTLTALRVCQLLTNGKVNNLPLTTGKALGIAQNATGTVMLKGVSRGHSALTPGVAYYYNTSTGVISTTSAGGILIGEALSTTTLNINDYLID